MTDRPFQLCALGEIAIRCRDFEAMQDFYGRVLGLARLRPSQRGSHGDGLAFYRFGESFGGHVAVLALFAHEAGGVSMSPNAKDGPLPWDVDLRCIISP